MVGSSEVSVPISCCWTRPHTITSITNTYSEGKRKHGTLGILYQYALLIFATPAQDHERNTLGKAATEHARNVAKHVDFMETGRPQGQQKSFVGPTSRTTAAAYHIRFRELLTMAADFGHVIHVRLEF